MNKLKIIIILLVTLCISPSSFAQKLTDLYKRVNSSVVVITTLNYSPENIAGEVEMVANASMGSGVLISEDGFIWTAAHVVQSAELVEVEFVDGDIYEAEVISSNPQADVALIKISSKFKLKQKHVAKIGDSDKVDIGEDVFVLGAPRGYKQSLSKGILSGRYEPESLSNDFVKIQFLQTDAAVNPGNSGGPMFNMKGEIIGIASRISTSSGGFEGIGFAMSSNVAEKLLMEEPTVWGGINSILISGDLSAALNVPQESGLLIISVSSKGPGSLLGLQGGYIPATINGTEILIGGDVILEIGGVRITDNNSLFEIRERIKQTKLGKSISISILRQGKIGSVGLLKNN
jgi:serine protease Do